MMRSFRRRRTWLWAGLAAAVVAGTASVWGEVSHHVYRQLSDSAWRGELGKVRWLLRLGLDPNQPVAGKVSPLIAAAMQEREEVVALLLRNGARVDAPGKMGLTALEAASRRGHLGVVRLLLTHGADLERVGEAGTPLMAAAQGCSPEVAEALLAAGARITATTSWSPQTALDLARDAGCQPVLELLRRGTPGR